MADMTCPKMKRKFEEVEQAVHSCIETLTGYEKCLLQNKLLLARSKMVKYESLASIYEAQVSMAKLEVEIATSDIDLLLQELQRGKRFKTGEAITTISTSTQTNSEPTLSPTKSVYDTSGISLELPRVDLTSFTRKRSDNGQEPSRSLEENAQESTTSQKENTQESTASQCSKDSGYNSSPKYLVSQEIQVDLPSVNTKEGNTEVKNTKKIKPINSRNKLTNEKPSKVNEEVPNINETTQKIDNTRRKSVQRRQSQDTRHRKRDERKSDSESERRNSAESQNKTTDRCDSLKNVPKHREKTKERKNPKEKCETFDEQQIPNRNDEGIKAKARHTSKSQNIRPRNANNRKSSDDDKSYKIHDDNRRKEAKKKSDQAQSKSERSQKKSEPAQKSNLNRRENTDTKMKNNEPIKAKNESDKANYESKKCEDRSCDTTLVIAEETMELETILPKRRIEDFEPFEIPHDSPIHYTDFANSILSSVAVPDATYITRNTIGGLNSQNTIAQSTPFVRRISTVDHSGAECQDLPTNVLCTDPSVEDQLTTFIKTTLADYNRDVAELNLKQHTHTITDKDTKTNDKNTIIDKTTKIYDDNTCKNIANDENTKVNVKTTKINEENACKADRKTKTGDKMIKSIPKQNLIVKIPVTRVPDAINHRNPTVVKIPVTKVNQITTTTKQPCLTVAVNDAGVITIRPRSVENSNLPSPKLEKTVVETHRQNAQDIYHCSTISNSKEPIIRTAKHILKSQDATTSKTPEKTTTQNNKHIEMPTETASYMTQVKDQYYFDVDSPRLADEAPTHKNAVSLFRAFSLLMPPSPTFTLSSSSDKENCKSTTPSPPNVQKLPINKKLLDDFSLNKFHSDRNYINTGFKNDIHTSHSNIMNNIYKNTKPMPVRRTSIADTVPRRTTQFTDAKPLPVRKTKSTSANPKPKTNRRKSLDDRAILRILNEPCSSLSSKSGSPKSTGPTPKKKDSDVNTNTSSDRLVYSLYKDIRTARCRNFTMKKSKHSCLYCGPVNEGHMCFFSLKKILEQC